MLKMKVNVFQVAYTETVKHIVMVFYKLRA